MRNPAFLFIALALTLALAGPAPARPHHHNRVVVVHERPVYTRVAWHGSHYWYHNGYYYRHNHGRYFLMSAPLGVVVPVLPGGFISLHFGAVPYWYYGGVYYRRAPGGYVVVEKPETVYVEKAAPETPDQSFVEPESKTVMIQNSNDSQTPVRLEKDGDKWKGPRGELYDAFPTDDQLRQAYGF